MGARLAQGRAPNLSAGESTVPATGFFLCVNLTDRNHAAHGFPAMDLYEVLKAGFMGFAQSLGILLLVFYVSGTFLGVSQRRFNRVFLVAAVASFVAVDLFLYYKVRVDRSMESPITLAGCIGGWLAGITYGLTQLKSYLKKYLK